MGRRLCPDPTRWLLAAGVAAGSLLLKPAWVQPVLVVASALVGWSLCPGTESVGVEARAVPYGRRGGMACLGLFGVLVFGLPWVASGLGGWLEPASGFVRAGAMVFGGGHVVLPLLEEAVVQPGWIRRDEFLTGYGAAQAVPGPMFTLAAFLGALLPGGRGGWFGALVGVLAIFLPGLLLVAGVLPFWHRLERDSSMTRMMSGVNAGVVGLLAAALVDPVWIGAVRGWLDALVALAALVALLWGRVPVIAVVVGCVAVGWVTRG
jgi:chromate transporter